MLRPRRLSVGVPEAGKSSCTVTVISGAVVEVVLFSRVEEREPAFMELLFVLLVSFGRFPAIRTPWSRRVGSRIWTVASPADEGSQFEIEF